MTMAHCDMHLYNEQAAYFDTVKDYIHLSERGRGFKPTIRFSIPDFDVTKEANFIRQILAFFKNV